MIPRAAKVGKALLVLAGALVPALASASIVRGPETRVWGFDFENAPLVGLGGSQAAESRRAYELGYGGSASDSTVAPKSGGAGKPQWLRDVEQGSNYNKARAFDYPSREVYVERPGGGYYRVDAYDPVGGEIVSRKATQFSKISEETGVGYVNELARKYPPGSKIANVPSSGPLAGQRLRGQMILEVPPQQGAVPQAVLDAARNRGIVIRDAYGNVY